MCIDRTYHIQGIQLSALNQPSDLSFPSQEDLPSLRAWVGIQALPFTDTFKKFLTLLAWFPWLYNEGENSVSLTEILCELRLSVYSTHRSIDAQQGLRYYCPFWLVFTSPFPFFKTPNSYPSPN